ncbi:MAG TPA: TfoX/Sxy family protein [Polyangiaceae bacterium]
MRYSLAMASRQSTIDYLLERFGAEVTAKPMFGEYGLYFEDVLFALVCDDQLFVKPTKGGRSLLRSIEEAPPYPGAKNAFVIAEDDWEDAAWLRRLARATADELPPPKKRKAKVPATRAIAKTKAKPRSR